MPPIEPRSWRQRYPSVHLGDEIASAPSETGPDWRPTVNLPDSLDVRLAATLAAAAHLKLVIDYNDGGQVKLTPVVFPGMQIIAAPTEPDLTVREAA